MASSRKSLSDFFGLSWSSWADYNGEFTHSDGDEDNKNEAHKKSSGVMQLYSSDMQKFGLFPETDCFCTVVCSECGAVVKPQGLLTHMRVRHKELVTAKSLPEKINKQTESPSIKNSGDKGLAKLVLNEKLMSKLVLNEKHANKTLSDKFSNAPSEKLKANIDKTGTKYSSGDKTLLKSSDKFLGKSAAEKLSRSLNEKASLEKSGAGSSLLIDKSLVKNESDKFSKSLKDSYSKQPDTLSSKISKYADKLSPRSVSNEKPLKYTASDGKFNIDGGFTNNERHVSRSSEKISVKSVLSEKLLSKVAASERGTSMSEKPKSSEYSKTENSSKKGDSLLRTDRVLAKPVMKSLLKDKVLRHEGTQNLLPGSSLLRPLTHHDREMSAPVVVALTTLSPPVLTPQNLTPECHALAADMPILSRKRKHQERKTAPTQYDPDRHCGVWCDYSNKFCVRSLTCKVHSMALRRAVVGRSKPFDQLLLEHKRAKEDQRLSKEDQDDLSEASPQLSERVHSPCEPSNSVSPVLSPESIFLSSLNSQDEAVTLCTPSTSTSPPTPLPSYQYPPYPPPDSAFSHIPESVVSLSPHLSSPLLNVALPSLVPSHTPRPPEEDFSKYPRTVARALNRLQLNKGRQFNVKHTAFPPKPLRTCLFQGRKSSGMFLIQREMESMRSGFRVSVVKGNKNLSLSHNSLANQSSADAALSLPSMPAHNSNETSVQNLGLTTSSQFNAPSGLKSVLSSLCTSKAVVSRDGQQRVQRAQKPMANGPESSISQPLSSENALALALASDKLPHNMRTSVPTTVPQQIAYLTTATPVPVTFQQVPILNSQVLSHLQLQSKNAGGTLKLLGTSGGGRTLYVHQYQDGSGAES